MLYQSTKVEKKLFIMCEISGALAEVVGVLSGSWTYPNPTHIIPLWLIPLWGIASIFITRMKNLIENKDNSKKQQSKNKSNKK